MSNQKIRAEQVNGNFNYEVPDSVLPKWMKDHANPKQVPPLKKRTKEET